MKKIFRWTILSILALTLSTDAQTRFQNNAPPVEKSNAVDAFVIEQMRQLHIPGLSLVIVRDSKIIKSAGYGLANVELNVKAAPETVYEIGSVTKQFTSTAIMMLVEENKIKLDAPVGDYLTDIPAIWKPITVRQLLNQTSGIKDYFTDEQPDFFKTAHFPAAKEIILKPALDAPLNYQPGESYNYSNTNHFLLGLLIEKTSGESYAVFLQKRIFAPLGMTATLVNDHRNVIANRAAGYNYDWSANVLQNADYVDAAWAYAAGALVSTVNDLAKWDIALDSEKLVGKASKNEMWTAGKLNSGAPQSVALVERIEKERGLLTRYRASYGNNSRLVKFVRNRAGEIIEWEDYEE